MIIDKEVDHGPIIKQEKYSLSGSETAPELTKILFTRGGEMIGEILDDWIAGKIIPHEQDHSKATFTKKLKKEDGLVDLADLAVGQLSEKIWRKYRAYFGWPGIYFMDKNNKRVKITDAEFSFGKFCVKKVIPEGKKEVNWEIFKSNFNTLK